MHLPRTIRCANARSICWLRRRAQSRRRADASVLLTLYCCAPMHACCAHFGSLMRSIHTHTHVPYERTWPSCAPLTDTNRQTCCSTLAANASTTRNLVPNPSKHYTPVRHMAGVNDAQSEHKRTRIRCRRDSGPSHFHRCFDARYGVVILRQIDGDIDDDKY